jgi:pyruvate formate lyase activating enzyme
MTATIFEIKRFAVHDGDGIRTTVFFKGCPLHCVWCHNPEGLSKDTQIAHYGHKCISCGECKKEGFVPENCIGESYVLYGKEMTVGELMPILLEDKEFYENSGGGITLSGGECLIYADFCAELLKRLKKEGVHTAVDTSGFISREALDKVIPYTDVFLYDIKAFDEDVHIKCTGQSNKIILENLTYLDSLEKSLEIRVPYVPDYNDGQMERIAAFLSTLKNIVKVRVLPYHNHAASKYLALGMENTLPKRLPADEEIKRAERIFGR